MLLEGGAVIQVRYRHVSVVGSTAPAPGRRCEAPVHAAVRAALAWVQAAVAVAERPRLVEHAAMKRTMKRGAAAVAAACMLSMPAVPLAQSIAPTNSAGSAAHGARGIRQQTYATPQEAVAGLMDALKAADQNSLLAVVGPNARSWLFSGDPVSDAQEWRRFMAAYESKHVIEQAADGRRAVLSVGEDGFPFAAPIVKRGDRWVFDSKAGREETLNRRIGRNELDTIQTLLAVVDAQREFAASDADGNGLHDYAAYFLSQPGKKNGLYWSPQPGQSPSPLGPFVAAAMKEGYAVKGRGLTPAPYNGYFFRMFSGQGRHANGGKLDYKVKGNLFGGFAVLAYPAKYGVSGVMTFMVNHEGVVVQRDLGSATQEVAARMARFDPDATWKRVD